MRPWSLPAMLVVLAIIALTPLAQASPPDQTWISGLYDNADYDDVVLSITSAVGLVESKPLYDTEPVQAIVTSVCRSDEGLLPTAPPSSHRTRAPPAS